MKLFIYVHIGFIVIFAAYFKEMNKPIRNRDKRIALLLAAAFAWLFIGSLVIFHEEHVLGKHFKLNSQLFISHKSKDKQGFTVKLLKPLLKLHDNNASAAILTKDSYASLKRNTSELKSKDSPCFFPDDFIFSNSPLRGPPSV